jgi:hypothetical protein
MVPLLGAAFAALMAYAVGPECLARLQARRPIRQPATAPAVE